MARGNRSEVLGGEEAAVDWIERIFHVSPDGGNGISEMAMAAVPALVVVGRLLFRRQRRFRLHPSPAPACVSGDGD